MRPCLSLIAGPSAWDVDFGNGLVSFTIKINDSDFVRVVRGDP